MRYLSRSVLLAVALACTGDGPTDTGIITGTDADSPGSSSPPSTLQLTLLEVVTGPTEPTYLTAPANDTRLFIVEQEGRIRVVQNGQLLATPFLDLTSLVLSGGERGLLSMVFHPQFAMNRRFYVYYT